MSKRERSAEDVNKRPKKVLAMTTNQTDQLRELKEMWTNQKNKAQAELDGAEGTLAYANALLPCMKSVVDVAQQLNKTDKRLKNRNFEIEGFKATYNNMVLQKSTAEEVIDASKKTIASCEKHLAFAETQPKQLLRKMGPVIFGKVFDG